MLQDLQLPSDNPEGGIDFVAVNQLTNPSAFSLDLGTVVFALSYKDVPLGQGSSFNTVIVNYAAPLVLFVPHPSSSVSWCQRDLPGGSSAKSHI